jgi:hypothetical protein
MPNKQHIMHGRDHEHGAADPTLIHYADTDTGSGGGGSILAQAYTTIPYHLPAGSGYIAVTWDNFHDPSGSFTWPVTSDPTKIGFSAGVYRITYHVEPVTTWNAPAAGLFMYYDWSGYGTGFISQQPILNSSTTGLYGTNGIHFDQVINLPAADDGQLYAHTANPSGFDMAVISLLIERLGDYIPGGLI